MRFANDFHSWLRHSWKLLANRLTRDPKIVIHGNSCIILYVLHWSHYSSVHWYGTVLYLEALALPPKSIKWLPFSLAFHNFPANRKNIEHISRQMFHFLYCNITRNHDLVYYNLVPPEKQTWGISLNIYHLNQLRGHNITATTGEQYPTQPWLFLHFHHFEQSFPIYLGKIVSTGSRVCFFFLSSQSFELYNRAGQPTDIFRATILVFRHVVKFVQGIQRAP